MQLAKRLLALAMVSAIAVSAVGCSAKNSSSSQQVTKPTTLNMALSVDPDGLDPQRTTAASTFQITNNIYDTLVKVKPDGTLVKGLADKWEVSKDGMKITFNLRPNLKFSNGKNCDAKAVAASFERLKADDSPRAKDYANFTVTSSDDTTVEVTTKTLDVAAITNFAYPWAAIVETESAATLKNKPVGTGAYTLKEWVPQQTLTLEKNKDYFDKVNIDTIKFKMMPDATAQISSLQNGELDIISTTGDQVSNFKDNSKFKVISNPTNGLQLMAMNTKNEALSDVRVRQAINYAVDKDELIKTVWSGYGSKIGSHYPVGLKEYQDNNDKYKYDPEKAKSLLEEAGYKDGLTLEMYLPKNYPAYVSAGQVIADSLKKVGINCKITVVEWATWLSDVYTGRKFDLTVVGHTGRLDPYVLLSRYHSQSKENYFNYSNPEVDKLLESYKGETDESKRTDTVKKIESILAEDVPAYYIQDPTSIYITSSKVSGFETYPIDIYEMKDVTISK